MTVRRRVHVAVHASVAANVFVECVFRQGRNEKLIESGGTSMGFGVPAAISPTGRAYIASKKPTLIALQ